MNGSRGRSMKGNGIKYTELLKWGERYLRDHGIEEFRQDAWLLFSHVTAMDRTAYLLSMDENIPGDTGKHYRQLIEKRGQRIPLQQLTGTAPFMGFDFHVTEDVLIPRLDTETLAQEALDFICRRKNGGMSGKSEDAGSFSVLDLCTGSGCLAVSLKLLCPDVRCTASDLSGRALAVARENAENLGAEVSFVRGNLFENICGKFDLIVCNPPYIRTDVIRTLDPEVRDHEPHMALDGGKDGLDFYRRIAAQARDYLNRGGACMLETGFDQGTETAGLLTDAGFSDVQTVKDLSGQDRVVKGFI